MRFLTVLFSVLCFCSLSAQRALKQPLAYVEGDSVVVWGQDYADLRGVALKADATVSTNPSKLSEHEVKYKALLKTWKNQWLPAFTLSGIDPKASGHATDSPALTASQALATAYALFAQTGDGTFMDAAERLLYNDLLRMTLAPGGSYEKHTAAQALACSPGHFYTTDADGIWVNLYANSTTHVKTQHFDAVVDQLTEMPFASRVKVRLSAMPRNGYPLTLHLRLPAWATGGVFPSARYEVDSRTRVKTPTVYVNGHELLTTQIERGYVVISRTWNRGDEVLIDFPLRPLYIHELKDKIKDSSEQQTSLLRGPLLYTLTHADATSADIAAIPPNSLRLDYSEDALLPIYRYNDITAIPYFSTSLKP